MPDKVYVIMSSSFEDYKYPIAVFADKDDAEKYIEEKEEVSWSYFEVPYNA